MPNGNVLQELRTMAEKDKLSTPQALPLLMAAVADIYENSEGAKKHRDELEKSMIVLAEAVKMSKEDIEELKRRSNLWDGVNSFLVVVGTSIMALLNKNG